MKGIKLLYVLLFSLSLVLYLGCIKEEGDDDDDETTEEQTTEEGLSTYGTITAPPSSILTEKPSPLLVGLIKINFGVFEEIDYGDELSNTEVEIDYEGETPFSIEIPELPPEEDFYLPDPEEAPDLEVATYIPVVYDDIDSSGGVTDDDPLYGSSKLQFVSYVRGTIPEDYDIEGLQLGWNILTFTIVIGQEEANVVATSLDTSLSLYLSGLEVGEATLNGLIINPGGIELHPQTGVFFGCPDSDYIPGYGALEATSGEEIRFSAELPSGEEIPQELFDYEEPFMGCFGTASFLGFVWVDLNDDGAYFQDEPIIGYSMNQSEREVYLLVNLQAQNLQPHHLSALAYWNCNLGWNIVFFIMGEDEGPESIEMMNLTEPFKIFIITEL